MARSLTLRNLFGFDESTLTSEQFGSWVRFQDRLLEETKSIKWTTTMPDLLPSVTELFDIPIVDVLLAAWKKADVLNAEVEATRKSPAETSFLSLSRHTVSSEFHPAIDVRIPGKTIKSIMFTARLSLTLEDVTLRVQNGRITHINGGRFGGKGSIHYGDLCLAAREFAAQKLPLAMPVEGNVSGGATPS